ncbi:flavoprotein [Jatrophihabitans sp. GAS493]|uniref:flavoprotein n=1 Tax=Jatrophihabitans sp. GAS493 TaxID=1907575 RepID=UPI001F53104A|nr:flavoprotein [Jatrophihabitans sp. GAS493]
MVVTGAPLSARCADIVSALQTAEVSVDLVTTPAAGEWIDTEAVTAATGAQLRSQARASSSSPRVGLPDLMIVCPATFNTVNKAALGIADTSAHGFICECIACRVPTIVVPMINDRLWGHPALASHIAALKRAGVHFLSPLTGEPALAPVVSGTGSAVVAAFDPMWLVEAIPALTS